MIARRHLLFCSLLALTLPALAVAQTPPAAPAVGTGVIAGTITAGDTGRPMRRVRVTLSHGETNAIVGTTATDTQGRFSFPKLPAAPFTLRATKPGYLDIAYGQKKLGSGRAGTSIQLTEGQKIENIALPMPRGGVISGTVVDEVGDVAFGVAVRAWRYVMRNGVRDLTPTGNAGTTDDRGQFRITALVPGEYIVCAAPRDEFVQAAQLYETMFVRVQETRAAAAAAGRITENTPNPSLMGPKPDDPRESYVPVCFPNTTLMSAATSIVVDVAEERSGHNLQLQLLPISRVSGTVSWNGGQMPIAQNGQGSTNDTRVQLVDLSGPNTGAQLRGAFVNADGTFSFTNVSPGQYTLEVHADVPMAQTAPAVPLAPGQRPPPPLMTPLWASLPITVGGQPISDLSLAMAHGQTVSGRVVIEGGAPLDLTRLRLTAIPVGPMYGEFAIPTTAVEADGRFTITGVVPGRYRIGAARVPAAGVAIKSSLFGGVDTLDYPIDVKGGENISGGVLTAIPQFAEITGQMQNASNQPATGFTIIAFPADQKFWTPTSRRIVAARPATDGRFALRDLPGGEYRLAAVTDVEAGQWFDRAFLREILPNSISVILADGERKQQTIQIK